MKIFKEEQRFNQLWIIVLMVISTLVPIGLIIKEQTENVNTLSSIETIGLIALIILASSFIFVFKLSSRIDEKGIYYKFFPFYLKYKLIEWSEINTAYVRTYDPLGEYGGWGIKGGYFWNKSKGKAINVSGDIGIQLELKNGKKLLIGTQKQDDAKRILEMYKSKLNTNV
jgi:uncharacterized membrane protein YobD (UPF0266 family)